MLNEDGHIAFRPLGFEDDDRMRSEFIRDLTILQIANPAILSTEAMAKPTVIPKTLIQYWHDPCEVPDDVRECLDSWHRLKDEGFEIRVFDDVSAAAYITRAYGSREREAFNRCRHAAMRSDYLRMCFVLAEGGLYVDADDVLLGDGWKHIFRNGAMKLQPLCYDILSGCMMAADEIWRADLPTHGRIFYVNNDPLAAPAGHPILQRALASATVKILGENRLPDIQSTTGPGNLSAALAAHANGLTIAGDPFDFELLRGWEAIAETRWDLSYRNDARNWRNMDIL